MLSQGFLTLALTPTLTLTLARWGWGGGPRVLSSISAMRRAGFRYRRAGAGHGSWSVRKSQPRPRFAPHSAAYGRGYQSFIRVLSTLICILRL